MSVQPEGTQDDEEPTQSSQSDDYEQPARRRRPLLLRRKYDLMQEHHRRLLVRLDPAEAQRRFERGITRGRRVERLQLVFIAMTYVSVVGAVGSRLLVGPLTKFQWPLNVVTGIAAGLSTVFLFGGVVCTRYLMLLDVDLIYDSQEARTPPPPARGPGGP